MRWVIAWDFQNFRRTIKNENAFLITWEKMSLIDTNEPNETWPWKQTADSHVCLHTHIFECFPIACFTPETFDLHWLLRKMANHGQHSLNISWQQVPFELHDHVVAFIKGQIHSLTKFACNKHDTECIKNPHHRYHQHQQVITVMQLNREIKLNAIKVLNGNGW